MYFFKEHISVVTYSKKCIRGMAEAFKTPLSSADLYTWMDNLLLSDRSKISIHVYRFTEFYLSAIPLIHFLKYVTTPLYSLEKIT